MSKNFDDVKRQLKLEYSSLKGDASLYESMMLKSVYSLSVSEYNSKKENHLNLVNEANHSKYKSESSKCLRCPKVMSCSFKSKC